jgi:hypothetical protein
MPPENPLHFLDRDRAALAVTDSAHDLDSF